MYKYEVIKHCIGTCACGVLVDTVNTINYVTEINFYFLLRKLTSIISNNNQTYKGT